MPRFFLSYRRADSAAYVHILDSRLRARFHRDDVFMDVRSVRPGQDFIDAIVETVASCSVLLAVIGREWCGPGQLGENSLLHQASDFVRLEIETAIKHELLIVPVLVGGAKMPAAEELPQSLQSLRRRNAITLGDVRLEEDVDRLIIDLEQMLGRRRPLGRYALAAAASALLLAAGAWYWFPGVLPIGSEKPLVTLGEKTPAAGAIESPKPTSDTAVDDPAVAETRETDERPKEKIVSRDTPGDGASDAPAAYVMERSITTLTPPKGSFEARTWNMAFSPDGRWLATADATAQPWYESLQSDGVVHIWNVDTGELLQKLAAAGDVRCGAVAFIGNERVVAACLGGETGRNSQSVRVWSLADGAFLRTLLDVDPVDGNAPIWFVGYSAAVNRIVALGGNERYQYAPPDSPPFANFRTWDAITGALDVAMRLSRKNIPADLSSDGLSIALPKFKGLEIRSVKSGELLQDFSAIKQSVDAVSFSDSSGVLAAATSDRYSPALLLVLEAESGQVQNSLALPREASSLKWLAGLGLVAYVGGSNLHIMRIADGTIIQTIAVGNTWIGRARFSADGNRLAVAVEAGTVHIYHFNAR